MSVITNATCRYFMLIAIFVLFFQGAAGQHKFSQIDGYIESQLNNLGGNAVFMVYKGGNIVFSNTYNGTNGKKNLRQRLVERKLGGNSIDGNFTPDTKIAIASCSKWLSAALVLTFIDEGKLRLNDTVGQFLPVMSKNGKGNITIAECLSHTTGIYSSGFQEDVKLSRNASNMDEFMQEIAIKEMEGKHGTVFHYSGIGLQIAEAVIEKISGKNFRTLFSERIAIPCNMSNTDFGLSAVPNAAGGARSTANDYMHFLSMVLNKGIFNGKQVLSENSINQMRINFATGKKVGYSPAEAGNFGYGLGVWTMSNSNSLSDAITSPGLFGTFPWIDFKNGYAAILLCFNLNNNGRHQMYQKIKQLTDDALL